MNLHTHNLDEHYWIPTFGIILLFSVILESCGDSSAMDGRKVTGSVKGNSGNPYPNTVVKLSNGTESLETKTNVSGIFEFNTMDVGTYQATIIPPLSTSVAGSATVPVDVRDDKLSAIDFVVQSQALVPAVVIEDADLFLEIKKEDGQIPNLPGDLLYASNVFDPPLGLLTPIKAPDDHHVTLSEWKSAQGTILVTCNGNTTSVEVSLTGMVPNGTYTLWLNFLNKKKSVGEAINFAADLVNIEPLGSGTENIIIADAAGAIQTTKQHASCIITGATALVMPIIYHINGNTYGADHIPDAEEVSHLLVYFQ